MWKEEHNILFHKYFIIFVVVALYWFISICTVFINKTLLSSSDINLEAPLFITWSQCIVSTIICVVMKLTSSSFPSDSKMDEGGLRKVLLLSIFFTLMVATNNLCLKYVGVAFYFVGRSMTTVFNVILSYFWLREKTNLKSVICCLAIVFGFMLGVDQERMAVSFSWWGTIFGVLGSLFLAIYSIYMKKVLSHVNQEIWLLSYYNNLFSSFLFLPLIVVNGELPNIIAQHQHIFNGWFMTMMVISGICGFSIGFVSALQIKVTSPLTHNISGTSKSCAQTVIAARWYNESKSSLWWISNVVVLFASAAYTRVKQVEMRKQHNNKIDSLPRL